MLQKRWTSVDIQITLQARTVGLPQRRTAPTPPPCRFHLLKERLATLHSSPFAPVRWLSSAHSWIFTQKLVQVMDGAYSDRFDHLLIFDCRSEEEYQGGHIRGALNITCHGRQKMESILFGAPGHSNGRHSNDREQLLSCTVSSLHYHGPRWSVVYRSFWYNFFFQLTAFTVGAKFVW